jgi:hypothetical protein
LRQPEHVCPSFLQRVRFFSETGIALPRQNGSNETPRRVGTELVNLNGRTATRTGNVRRTVAARK